MDGYAADSAGVLATTRQRRLRPGKWPGPLTIMSGATPDRHSSFWGIKDETARTGTVPGEEVPMRYAGDDNGKAVAAASADRSMTYHCPLCGGGLVLRHGRIRAPYFAHQPGAACRWRARSGATIAANNQLHLIDTPAADTAHRRQDRQRRAVLEPGDGQLRLELPDATGIDAAGTGSSSAPEFSSAAPTADGIDVADTTPPAPVWAPPGVVARLRSWWSRRRRH